MIPLPDQHIRKISVNCNNCNGLGIIISYNDKFPDWTCEVCNGTGEECLCICQDCNGKGFIRSNVDNMFDEKCLFCFGTGFIKLEKS